MAESRVFKLMNGVTLEMLGEAVERLFKRFKRYADSSGTNNRWIPYTR